MNKPLPPKTTRVHQLSVWNPGELELELFSLYSPIHALLWLATSSANWMLMLFIMGFTGVQVSGLTRFVHIQFNIQIVEYPRPLLSNLSEGQGTRSS